MRAILLFLTLTYLVIESQSLIFLWNTLSSHLSQSQLSSYERFGYASAGIGITLSLYRLWCLKQKKTVIQIGVLFFITPFLYIICVWGIYDLVNRTPQLIPDQYKPQAMRASIQLLTNPQNTPFYVFYLNTNKNKSLNLKKFTQEHPLKDKQIQALYLQGIRAINLLATYTLLSVDKLHRNNLFSLWQKALYTQLGAQTKTDTLHQLNYLKKTINKHPLSGVFLINESVLAQYKPKKDIKPYLDWYLISDIVCPSCLPFSEQALMELSQKSLRNNAWDHLATTYTYLPLHNKIIENKTPLENMRYWYSQKVFSKYVNNKTVPLLPWYNNKINPLKEKAFLFVLEQNAPFLFFNHQPAIDLTIFRNKNNLEEVERNLLTGLSPKLKSQWKKYRLHSIKTLIKTPKAWHNITTFNLNKAYLKISTILPLLLGLSITLLIINLFFLLKEYHLLGVIGLSIPLIVYVMQSTFLPQLVLKALLVIATKEATIFLY